MRRVLSSRRMTTDDTPPPVPGFERFRWVGLPVYVPVKRKYDFQAQLVRRGNEAGIVLVVIPDEQLGEHLASITLDGAFTSWPPRIGDLIVHRPVQLWNRAPRLAARSTEEVLVWSGDPFTFSWGRPGSTPYDAGPATEASDAAEAPRHGPRDDVLLVGRDAATYAFELVRAADRSIHVVRHGSRAGRSASELDLLPEASHRVVTTRGTILGVKEHIAPRLRRSGRRGATVAPVATRIETSVFPNAKGSGAMFELPGQARVADLVADHDGGAWLACWNSDGSVVYHLDANGGARGPLRLPYAGSCAVAITSWRDGYVLYAHRRGIALVVSDGMNMTRVEGLPGGEGDITLEVHSLLVSPDARSILLCHRTSHGIQIMRADLAPGLPGESLPDVWAEDRLAYAAVLEKRAAAAGAPRLPGWPLETTNDGSVPPRLHTKARIVRQARLRYLVSTFSSLWSGEGFEATRFRGDDRAGAFVHDDGSGGLECFVWSDDGLVATSYDCDLGGPMGEPANADNAPLCFPDLPDALRPLLEQAIRTTDGRVSGGLWVTTGADARWHEEGSFGDDFSFYVKTPEDSLVRAEQEEEEEKETVLEAARVPTLIALADKSSAGPHVLTEDQERVLLTSPRAPFDASPKNVAGTIRALAAVGITWRDAEARAAMHVTTLRDAGLAALGVLQVDLLRAAAKGDAAAVSAALDAGADIECTAVEGVFSADDRALDRLRTWRASSPLAVATSRGHEDVVDLLLSRGAKLEGHPPKPQRPPALVAALLARRGALFVRLASLAPDFDADGLLHTHVHQGRPTTIDVVRLLLDRGASPVTGAERSGVREAAEAAGDEQLAARFGGKPR